jgi:hypothetical protein
MADHPLLTAATAEAGLVRDTLLDAFMRRMPLSIGPTESLVDIVQSVGSVPLCVASGAHGNLYFYDETDTTTADDGITCLVDGNGHRYKIGEDAAVKISSVLSALDAPPGSPSLGDSYIVDVAPTGAWSAHAKDLAIWTSRGWVFAEPQVGTTVLDESTGNNTQYSAAGSWGAFGGAISDLSIAPAKLSLPFGTAVESTLNTPPGSPTVGLYYIVGSVPTGDFVGHSADVATYSGTAWTFIDPYEGASVYHITNGYEVFYNSGSWLGDAANVQTFTSTGTWTKPSKGSMAIIELWGGGGSGGRAGAGDGGGGGAGGGYIQFTLPLASLAATVAVTIGDGGASRTTDESNGAAGGNTTFGAHGTGYGGGGGCGATGNAGGGGGGGGQAGAGTTATSIASAAGGAPAGMGAHTGGAGGAGNSAGVGTVGALSVYGGGGGGGGGDGGNGGAGGASIWGGGGGGGAGDAAGGAGGTSTFGGAGGAGAFGATAATAGTQPGGGGGGSETGNSGAGGAGMCRVTVV